MHVHVCVTSTLLHISIVCNFVHCILEETSALLQPGPTGMPDPNQPPYPGTGAPPGGYPPQPAGVRTCVSCIDENAPLCH